LCALLVGCGEDPDTTASWEHSYTSLFDAEISNDGRFAVVPVSTTAQASGIFLPTADSTIGVTTIPTIVRLPTLLLPQTVHM